MRAGSEAAQVSPQDISRLLRRKFSAAVRQRNWGEADELLARLKAQEPLSPATRGSELQLLVAKGQLAEARTLAQALLAQFPSSAGIRFHAALAAYRRRDYARALDDFRESARLHPSWRTEHWIAKTLTQMGRFAEAEPALVRLCADHCECLNDLSWMYERMGDTSRALGATEQLLARRPADAFALSRKTRLLSAGLSDDEVLEEVASLQELGEAVPDALAARQLEALLGRGSIAEARALVERVLDNAQPALANHLGWIAHRMLAHDLCVSLFLAALPARAEDPKMLGCLETHAAKCGQEERVAAAMEQQAASNPGLHTRAKRLRELAGKRKSAF